MTCRVRWPWSAARPACACARSARRGVGARAGSGLRGALGSPAVALIGTGAGRDRPAASVVAAGGAPGSTTGGERAGERRGGWVARQVGGGGGGKGEVEEKGRKRKKEGRKKKKRKKKEKRRPPEAQKRKKRLGGLDQLVRVCLIDAAIEFVLLTWRVLARQTRGLGRGRVFKQFRHPGLGYGSRTSGATPASALTGVV